MCGFMLGGRGWTIAGFTGESMNIFPQSRNGYLGISGLCFFEGPKQAFRPVKGQYNFVEKSIHAGGRRFGYFKVPVLPPARIVRGTPTARKVRTITFWNGAFSMFRHTLDNGRKQTHKQAQIEELQ